VGKGAIQTYVYCTVVLKQTKSFKSLKYNTPGDASKRLHNSSQLQLQPSTVTINHFKSSCTCRL
jgi:hypothetical protein